jgi:hypothetical protein
MPKWKKLVLGDHPFTLKSRDPNFYRDMALVLPLFVFIFGAFAYLPTPGPGRKLGYEFPCCGATNARRCQRETLCVSGASIMDRRVLCESLVSRLEELETSNWSCDLLLGGLANHKGPWLKPSYGIPDEFGFWELMTLLAPLTGSLAFVWLVIKHQPLP